MDYLDARFLADSLRNLVTSTKQGYEPPVCVLISLPVAPVLQLPNRLIQELVIRNAITLGQGIAGGFDTTRLNPYLAIHVLLDERQPREVGVCTARARAFLSREDQPTSPLYTSKGLCASSLKRSSKYSLTLMRKPGLSIILRVTRII